MYLHRRKPHSIDGVLIKHVHSAASDRPEGKFLMPGNTELPQHEHIEWGAEGFWLLQKRLDATARESEHYHIVPPFVGCQ